VPMPTENNYQHVAKTRWRIGLSKSEPTACCLPISGLGQKRREIRIKEINEEEIRVRNMSDKNEGRQDIRLPMPLSREQAGEAGKAETRSS